MDQPTGSEIRQRMGENAARMTAGLAEALEAAGREPFERVRVGAWDRPALAWDEAARKQARQARDGYAPEDAPEPRRGRGETFWRNNVGIIKFCFLEAVAAGWVATRDAAWAETARDYFEEFLAFYPQAP